MLLPNRDHCSGCGTCAAVCSKGCIRMRADSEGLLYPEVDRSQCVDCKLCEKACAVLHRPRVGESVQISAVQNMDEDIRKESSSGGVFTALAEMLLRQGGAVCGAVYSEDFTIEHRIAFTAEDIAAMRGAKYAQSYAGHLFGQLKQLLIEGTPVMFVGTPCQCAGLKSYLGKDYENLILVDMICHGVPAPAVWKAYVSHRRKLDAGGQKVASINLRDKSTGWSNYAYSVRFSYVDGSVYSVLQGQDPYMRGFVSDLYSRPSCSDCSFKGVNRCSDFTLGDCWGIWDTHPDFDDKKGTSLLLIHSAKAKKVWGEISHGFRTRTLTEEEATKCNPSALISSDAHSGRKEFFRRLSTGEPVDELIWDILRPKTPKQNLLKRILHRLVLRWSHPYRIE